MFNIRSRRRALSLRSRGMTLVELLVVTFILLLFVSAAVPLLSPNNSDRKIREASRQVNAYIAEARALAAAKGRPVGIYLDRSNAASEGSRDTNLITRLQLAEVPPNYSGDTLTANVTVASLPPAWPAPYNVDQPFASNFAPNSINGVAPVAFTVNLDPSGTAENLRLQAVIGSYSNAPVMVPIGIRLGGSGSFYSGCIFYTDLNTPLRVYFFAAYGTQFFHSPKTGVPLAYEMVLPPQVTLSSPLDLPTGTAIDLQFSGYGSSGNGFGNPATGFFDSSRAIPTPVVVMFGPGGEVGLVQNFGTFNVPLARLHFLIGLSKIAVDSIDFTPANSNRLNITNSLINSPEALWVSIHTQSGHVTTSDNVPPQVVPVDPANPTALEVATAVKQARALAIDMNTKGGR